MNPDNKILEAVMLKISFILLLMGIASLARGEEKARFVEPAYQSPKVVYEFFLDDPAKLGSALYWVRSLVNPLTQAPYDMAPEFMDIKLVMHGTEMVTLAKKNYAKYRDVVERMRYYAALGVEIKACGMAVKDYGYTLDDLHEFVEVVPSAFTELVHWQQQGYALIIPQVPLRSQSIEEIR
jgi:intracellular sulfur oxidation DsrE/DsrF family protein